MGAFLSTKIRRRRKCPTTTLSSCATPTSDELVMESNPKKRKCSAPMSCCATPISDMLVMEILLRLSVRSVLRCRSVSRSWRELIDSPEFIRRYVDRSDSDKSDSRIIIAGNSHLYTIHDLDFKDRARAEILNSPSNYHGGFFMVGSSRGVLCAGCPSGRNNEAKRFILWNPSSRGSGFQWRVVESSGIELLSQKNNCKVNYCFGYDHVKDDYILVRTVARGVAETYGFQLEVYSLRSDSWKTILNHKDGRFPYYYIWNDGIAFVDGVKAIHFVVAENKESMNVSKSIAAFDLRTESFSLVPMPEDGDSDGWRWLITGLTSLDGSLCLCNNVVHHNNYSSDVWVMKDYGMKESWIKLVSFERDLVESNLGTLLPIAHSQSGRKLLIASDDDQKNGSNNDQQCLQCYDLENKSLERVTVSGLPALEGRIQGCVCSASLVWI